MMNAIIDWLSFTVKEYEGKEATPSNVIQDILSLDISMFQLTHGGHGYKKQFIYNDIRVYFDGNENMGIHVQISGNGIRFFESTQGFKWSDFLYLLINWFNAKLTRLDVAVDEMEGILNLKTIEEKIRMGHIVSRWRSGRPIPNYDLSSGETDGHTIYFGKRESEILCRFYDKRAEQKERYEAIGEELPEHWIRCELEMHGERATMFASIYSNPDINKTIGELFAGTLNNYMRITEGGTDKNKIRWKNCEMWDKFISTTERLQLTIKKPEQKIQDLYIWLKKSVSASLYLIYMAAKQNIEAIMDLIKEGAKRINKKHIAMLETFEKQIPDMPPYRLEEARQGVKEKIFNLNWRMMEESWENRRLLKQMIELNKIEPFTQLSFN